MNTLPETPPPITIEDLNTIAASFIGLLSCKREVDGQQVFEPIPMAAHMMVQAAIKHDIVPVSAISTVDTLRAHPVRQLTHDQAGMALQARSVARSPFDRRDTIIRAIEAGVISNLNTEDRIL